MSVFCKFLIATSVAAAVGLLASSNDASAKTMPGTGYGMTPANHGYDANVCRAGVHIRAAPCPTCTVMGVIPYPSVIHVYDTQAQPAGWAYGYTHIDGNVVHGYFPTSTWQC